MKKEINIKAAKSSAELKGLRLKYKQNKQQIEDLISSEIKVLMKERFDYSIPVIQVDKAGISSTGAPCENELVDVAKEFTEYRENNPLWTKIRKEVTYPIDEEGIMYRSILLDGKLVNEPEIFYPSDAN